MKWCGLSLGIVALGLVAIGSFGAAPPAAEPSKALDKLARQRLDAARKTYEVSWKNYREGRGSAELLYRWSKRWLKAERELSDQPDAQAAACKAHWERMSELDRLIAGLQRAGQTTVDEVSAAEFYRTEAEYGWLQAKEKKQP